MNSIGRFTFQVHHLERVGQLHAMFGSRDTRNSTMRALI
jgi:hypothetical protein